MKWHWKVWSFLAVCGLICGGATLADETTSKTTQKKVQKTRVPDPSESTETRHALFQEGDEETPFEDDDAAPQPPLPDAAYEEPKQSAAPAPLAADIRGIARVNDGFDDTEQWLDDDCDTCGQARCDTCAPDYGCQSSCGGSLGSLGIEIGGWIDQGITVNGRMPEDRFNGPVTFNDRDGEYQLNQLWVYAERIADTGGCGWDIGGRVDFVYGTDSRFTQSIGLEDSWNSHRFYGAALPQTYLDVAFNDWTVRMGHFYTIIGYEVVTAPDNFFYSRSYALQYGEPFTHTGLLASYSLNDQINVSVGFDRGWNTWEDNNDDLSVLTGISGTSYDGRTTLACAVTVGDYDDPGLNNRSMYSVVFTHQLSCRLQYVLQHDYGIDLNGSVRPEAEGRQRDNAEWYGLNQYLLYDINDCWGLGFRFEWFRDDDGSRVGGIGAPNGWNLGPDIPNDQIGWAGNFFAATFGINWKPTDRIIVRPEGRWDWYDGPTDAQGRFPYDFGEHGSQFTFGTDLIITF